MAILNWVKRDEGGDAASGHIVLSRNTVSHRLALKLREEWNDQVPPHHFEIHEVPSAFLAILLRLLRIERNPVTPVSLKAVKVAKGVSESEHTWSAAVPPNRTHVEWFFTDDKGFVSPQICVTKRAVSTREGRLGATVGIGPTALIPAPELQVRADVEHKVITVEAVTDPVLRAELILPWEADVGDLRKVIHADISERVIKDLPAERREEADSLLAELLAQYLPNTPPPRWEITTRTEAFEVGPDAPAEVKVLVLAPTPGRAAFWVRLVNVEDEARDVVVTDAIPVVREDGAGEIHRPLEKLLQPQERESHPGDLRRPASQKRTLL